MSQCPTQHSVKNAMLSCQVFVKGVGLTTDRILIKSSPFSNKTPQSQMIRFNILYQEKKVRFPTLTPSNKCTAFAWTISGQHQYKTVSICLKSHFKRKNLDYFRISANRTWEQDIRQEHGYHMAWERSGLNNVSTLLQQETSNCPPRHKWVAEKKCHLHLG